MVLLCANFSYKADSEQYWEYDMTGGTGWYCTEGQMRPLRWTKGDPAAPLRLIDEETGAELTVKTGKSYIGFVPAYLAEQVTFS